MREPLGPQDLPPPNLFTPDFGQDPHMIVGRDALVRALRQGMAGGPKDRRFTSLLLGPRGSGKTVILNLARDIARESGWIVLSLDAATAGVHERIRDYIAWVQDTHEAVPDTARAGHTETTFGVRGLPLEWQRKVVREVGPQWSLRRQLTTLAQHASRHGTSVLLILDELHSGERSELRRLSADMQHMTKGETLPLAFLGAGLGEMDHTLLEDRKMTFFRRCARHDMPPISREDASRFLSQTISDAGGEITGPALARLSEAAGESPHRMQLLGHCAWLAADAPVRPVDEPAAAAAVKEAARLMDQHVSEPTWNALSETEQSFLYALAGRGGSAHLAEIETYLAADAPLGRVGVRLRHAGCVRQEDDGRYVLTDLIPAGSVRAFMVQEGRNASTATLAPSSATPRRRPRCNEWMPRSQARCILGRGHAGGCRSR